MRALLEGQTISFAYESVRLFLLCQGMQWAHLPVAGGIYDQHPLLIDEWAVLFSMQSEHERARNERESKQMNQQQNVAGPGIPRIR